MIKLRILRWESNLDYSGGPNVITRILIGETGRQESESQRDSLMTESRIWSEAIAGWGAMSNGMWVPPKLDEAREWILP